MTDQDVVDDLIVEKLDLQMRKPRPVEALREVKKKLGSVMRERGIEPPADYE